MSEKVILIADYGRSGQGWLSYMLCYILNAKYIEPYDFLKGMLYTTDERVISLTGGSLPNRPKSPYSMVIKTHNWPAKNVNLTDKIIFLTRDPRDIAVSAYYRYKELVNLEPPTTLKERLFYTLSSIRPLSYAWTAHKWKKFIRLWTERPDIKYHRVKYENVSSHPVETLKEILNYLEVKASDKLIQEAIDNFTFDKLSGREKGKEESKSMPFRKGVVGDFKNQFSRLELKIFHAIAGKTMKHLGYRTK
ncbi:MAG: sulfotransferase domain-containing protein [Candidatus Colwellbacteria bacterium]|nr:sulfotransferase domain-containing protein [Candidatus Colwellbacteria bacterium]